ncbi:MAG TPA: YggS family pyridoxal phosphate-dependent enzyme [Fimbriimonadaceae bacterium]|nr:YggS family pyridoxal phosphate-dependent enzyme [Fimbriimonadaceae bacterium]
MGHVTANLREIRQRIARACESCGRDPASVCLVAVSKTFGADAIREAYDAGQRHFGESKLQEALPKIAQLPDDIMWHFIGKLQSNKARRAADAFRVIHSLENERQVAEIGKGVSSIDGLVEVNIAQEAQKSGVLPPEVAHFWKIALQCERIHPKGLMTIGPANLSSEAIRPFFRTMRELLQLIGGEWLSMGMSHDFEVALQEGATHIRVGTAIFGSRD